jgi:hypothetical protein
MVKVSLNVGYDAPEASAKDVITRSSRFRVGRTPHARHGAGTARAATSIILLSVKDRGSKLFVYKTELCALPNVHLRKIEDSLLSTLQGDDISPIQCP